MIDEASDTVTRTIPVGTSTYGLALDPAARIAYLTDYFSGEVSVLDLATDTVIGPGPRGWRGRRGGGSRPPCRLRGRASTACT